MRCALGPCSLRREGFSFKDDGIAKSSQTRRRARTPSQTRRPARTADTPIRERNFGYKNPYIDVPTACVSSYYIKMNGDPEMSGADYSPPKDIREMELKSDVVPDSTSSSNSSNTSRGEEGKNLGLPSDVVPNAGPIEEQYSIPEEVKEVPPGDEVVPGISSPEEQPRTQEEISEGDFNNAPASTLRFRDRDGRDEEIMGDSDKDNAGEEMPVPSKDKMTLSIDLSGARAVGEITNNIDLAPLFSMEGEASTLEGEADMLQPITPPRYFHLKS